MPHRAATRLGKRLRRCGIIRAWVQDGTTGWRDDTRAQVGRMTPSFLPPHYIERTRFGSLAPYIEPYLTLVLNEGYKPTTIRGQLRLIARLNGWLRRRHQDLHGLNEPMVEHFLQCQGKKWRTPASGVRVTLQRLLGVLRDAGVVAP